MEFDHGQLQLALVRTNIREETLQIANSCDCGTILRLVCSAYRYRGVAGHGLYWTVGTSIPGPAHSYSSTLQNSLNFPRRCWFDHTHPSPTVPVLRHVWLETRDPVHVAHACVPGIMTQLCLVWAEQDMTSSLLVTEVHPSRRIITETEIQP